MVGKAIQGISNLPGQNEIPGCEAAPLKARLSLKPGKAQKPCDHGLFGDQATQVDLLDLLK